MAQELPTSELNILKSEGEEALKSKQAEFSKQNKEFRYDPYSGGVVPDDIYDSLRYSKDPKYKGGKNG